MGKSITNNTNIHNNPSAWASQADLNAKIFLGYLYFNLMLKAAFNYLRSLAKFKLNYT